MAQKITARCDEQALDAIFAAVDQSQLPGAAIGIAIDGVPVYRKGFGRANLELPTLLTPSMRMRIGSTTKHFAALAYLLLCEDGLAGIDDEIGKYVPGLKPVNARATMRRLMGHISGIRDVLSVTMAFHGAGRPVTDEQMIAYYRTIDDVDFEPGKRWCYNNGGYILLSAAIEKITGKRLEDVLRERIFTPIGMHDTMLRRWDSDFVPNSATLHFRDAKGVFSRTYMGMEITGAGGMVTTMDDMLRWLRHMDAPFVGSAQTWRTMREPQRQTNGASTQYGLGLVTERYRGVEVVHHGGGVMGGNSQMIKVPCAKLDISLAVNRSDVSALVLAYAIIDACVAGLEPQPEPVAYEKRTGTFLSATDGRIATLTAAGDMHVLSLDGGMPMPVSLDGEGVLRLPASLSFFQQSVQSEADAIVLTDFGQVDRLTQIETNAALKLGVRAGTYRCDAMDATIELIEDGDGLRAITRGRYGWANYQLTSITANLWRIEQSPFASLGAIVTFDSDGRGLTLDFTRMRSVRFRKVD